MAPKVDESSSGELYSSCSSDGERVAMRMTQIARRTTILLKGLVKMSTINELNKLLAKLKFGFNGMTSILLKFNLIH